MVIITWQIEWEARPSLLIVYKKQNIITKTLIERETGGGKWSKSGHAFYLFFANLKTHNPTLIFFIIV